MDNIFDLETEQSAVMTVRHFASGNPLLDKSGKPMTLTLAGKDSDRFRMAQEEQREFRLRKAIQTGQERPTLADMRAETIDLIAACTISWSIMVDGEPYPCTRENVREVYRRLPWLVEQADEFITGRANFLKASAGA
jgi:hypothetical protein